MPYNPWREFRRQHMSLWSQAYAKRPGQHTAWASFSTFLPQNALLLSGLDAWMHQTAGTVTINPTGIHPELREGLRALGAMLENYLRHVPLVLLPTAVAAVIYDAGSDTLHYGTSGFLPSTPVMRVHPVLAAREQGLPVNPQGIRTLVGNRSPRTCSEFKVLNKALLAQANEADLFCWTFRIRDMTPMPQCPNCRVTVPRSRLGRLWTG